MTKPDLLAAELIERSLELFRLRLWLTFDPNQVTLVQLPIEASGEIFAAIVSFVGPPSDDPGVLVLGTTDLSFVRQVFAVEAALESLDLFRVAVIPFSFIHRRGRGVHQQAGFTALPDAPAPQFICKPAQQLPRDPDRAEQQTLLHIVNALLTAHREGALKPLHLDAPQLLTLKVSGSPDAPAVTYSFTKGLEVLSSGEPDHLATSEQIDEFGTDFSSPQRLDEDWIVAVRRGPMPGKHDRTEYQVVVVIERESEESRLVIDSEPTPEGAAAVIVAAISGESPGEPGYPRRMTILDAAVARVLTSELESLDVELVVAESDPVMESWFDRLSATAARLSEAEHLEPHACDDSDHDHEPESELEMWRRVEESLEEALEEGAHRANRSLRRAAERYFGAPLDPDDLCSDENVALSARSCFEDWLFLRDRPNARAKTIAELVLRRGVLDEQEEALLRARMAAVPSLYRTVSVDPGVAVVFEDVLDGRQVEIPNAPMSLLIADDAIFMLEVYPAGPFLFAKSVSPDIPSTLAAEVAGDLAEADPDSRWVIAADLWRDVFEFVEEGEDGDHHGGDFGPEIRTSHGDPLELLTGWFLVDDMARLERALRSRDDVDQDPNAGHYVWLEPATSGPDVIGAFLRIVGDLLQVEVTARRRLESVTEWLEEIPGVRLKDVNATVPSGTSDDALPSLGGVPADAAEMLQEFLNQHYRGWVDERVPFLGNKTPRQACKSASGRKQVEHLIRTLPSLPGPTGGTIEPPRDELLRELGLGANSD